MALKLFRRGNDSTAVTVYDREGHDDGIPGDLFVNGKRRQIVMYRPPVVLGEDGETLPGVDRQVVANYLVATTGMLSNVDLGPVRVDWKGRSGRFAAAELHMETWGQSLTVVMPVHVISQELNSVMEMYQRAVCLKAREIHRGHQDYGEPNSLLQKAYGKLERLRDATAPHFTDGEFLFLAGQLGSAMVMNALVPLPQAEGEAVIGQTARVKARDGRLPAGG